MKYTLTTNMLANNTNAMMIIVTWRLTPKIGSPSEVTGRKDGITSRNTVMARRTVVTKPIRSPLSTWIRKLLSARTVSKTEGIVR